MKNKHDEEFLKEIDSLLEDDAATLGNDERRELTDEESEINSILAELEGLQFEEPVTIEKSEKPLQQYFIESTYTENPEAKALRTRTRKIKVKLPVIAQAQPEEPDKLNLPILSTDEVKSLFTIGNREQNCAIAIELTKRRISPYERGFPTYGTDDCKRPELRDFMNDLRACEMQWTFTTHHGITSSVTAFDGLFAEIFTNDSFDWSQAYAIAELKLSDTKRLEYLGLLERASIQKDFSVMRTDTVKKIHKNAKDKKRRDELKSKGIERQSLEIRDQLQKYKDNKVSSRLDVEGYRKLWLCREFSKGGKNYLTDTIQRYEKLTGELINKSTLRGKLTYLDRAIN